MCFVCSFTALTGFVTDVAWSVDGHLDCVQVCCYLRRVAVDDDRHVEALTCTALSAHQQTVKELTDYVIVTTAKMF